MNANDVNQLNLINGKETLWIDRGWRSNDKDANLSDIKLLNHELSSNATDYAEVDTRNLSTFYSVRRDHENPTPYATTTLINTMPRNNIVSIISQLVLRYFYSPNLTFGFNFQEASQFAGMSLCCPAGDAKTSSSGGSDSCAKQQLSPSPLSEQGLYIGQFIDVLFLFF